MSLYRPSFKDPKTGAYKQSAVFWMDFIVNGQRVRESTGQRGISRAKQVEDKRKAEIRLGIAGIRKPDPPGLFAFAAADWVAAKKPKWSAGMLQISSAAIGHLTPVFGKMLTSDIDARDVSKYQKARIATGASNRSVNMEIGALRAILKRAGLWARIQPGVEMLPERDDVGHALTPDEEKALLSACAESRSPVLLPFVTLALETAARYGTIRRLQWGNVDFASRCLTFGKDKTRAGSGRTIPLTPRALEMLRFWAERFPNREPGHFVFPAERIGGAGKDDVFGFTAAKVYSVDPTAPTGSIKTAWKFARKRTRYVCPRCTRGRLADATKPAPGFVCTECEWRTAELPAGLIAFRLHDCRHTGVSRMIAARVPLPIIAKIVGWSAGTLAKMAARYGHFSMEEMRAALESATKATQPEPEYPKNPPKLGESAGGPIQ